MLDGVDWTVMNPQPFTVDPEFGYEVWEPQAPMVPGDAIVLKTMFFEGYAMDANGAIWRHDGEWIHPKECSKIVRQFGAQFAQLHCIDALHTTGPDYEAAYWANHGGRP